MVSVYLCISFLLNYQISIIILIVTFTILFQLFSIEKILSHLSGQFTYRQIIATTVSSFKSSIILNTLNPPSHFHFFKTYQYPYQQCRKKPITTLLEHLQLLKQCGSPYCRSCCVLYLSDILLHQSYYFNLCLFSLALLYRTLNYIILTQNNFQRFNSYEASLDNILNLLDDFNAK